MGVFDCEWNPIAGYPAQDIWLDDTGDGLVQLCQGGSLADADTDLAGLTVIARAIRGGGGSAEGTRVYVAGMPMQAPPVPVDLVSPDLDGDLVIDITDFGLFGEDFGSSAFRSDLEPDGIVDIVDFGVFGSHFGESCP